MEQFENNFIENSLMILTKQTVDIFLKQKNNSELIALYVFYYYTAKWQKTNQPKCTTSYVAKALHWCRNKVIKAKKQLIEFGLIEDVRKVDPETKKVVGYYIKMNYIFKNETLEKSQCTQNPHTGFEVKNKNKSQCTKSQTLDFEYTNALSDKYINALSTNNIKKERKKDLNDNSLFKRENENEIKKISAEKNSTEKKKISFDEIIENYTQNEKLRKELKEHLCVRKAKRAALTDHALELSLKKLDSLANSENEKIEIVQNAIMNGWTAFYPLRAVKTNSVFSTSSYNINNYEKSMDMFDAQVKEEERKKAKAEARAKVIELAEKEHEENVRKYSEKYAQELEECDDLEEYESTKDYFNHLLAKGFLLDGTCPPKPKTLEYDLFENIENEEDYFTPP